VSAPLHLILEPFVHTIWHILYQVLLYLCVLSDISNIAVFLTFF